MMLMMPRKNKGVPGPQAVDPDDDSAEEDDGTGGTDSDEKDKGSPGDPVPKSTQVD
jgi:hypothetical protein